MRCNALSGNGRKLHIGLDPESGEIVASLLTTDGVGDETALPELTANIDTNVSPVLADGAYDGRDVFNALTKAFGPDVEVIIPPPKNGAVGLYDARDAHLRSIEKIGRMAWQTATGYDDRALVEAHPLMHARHALPGSGSVAGNRSSATRSNHVTSPPRSPKSALRPKFSTV